MFSKSTEYALRATIFIARHATPEQKVNIITIARGIGAPKPFTAKILQLLSNASQGVVSSVSGPSGGFYISPEARKLPIITVLEIMNELDTIQKCILGLPHCSDITPCSMHKNYKLIKQDILQLFSEKTIDELARSKDAIM